MAFRVVLLIAVLVVGSAAGLAQVSTWWTSGGLDNTEEGRVHEIKEKHRVFVSVNYRSTDPNSVNVQQELAQLRGAVSRSLTAYKGLEIVLAPERAELAITVTATHSPQGTSGQGGNFAASRDPDEETSLEVMVLVRGAMQRDGGYRPRVVWELSSPNVRGESAPAAAFALDGFISQLKKLRGESNKK